jgi:hypothetical protein
MGSTSKGFSLLLVVILAASSLMMVESAFAQSIPKPSVPEFIIKLVDSSYDVPATYSTDQYTGEKVLLEPAHSVDNRTFELWIKNQQYTYSNGSSFRVYYDIRTGGHFGGGVDLYYPSNWLLGPDSDRRAPFISRNTPMQSTSDYTVIILSAVNPPQSAWNVTYPPNARVDFQVKAMIGHDSYAFGYAHIGGPGELTSAVAVAAESDWSNIQTINLTDGSVSTSTSPNPTPNLSRTATPSVPEFSWLAILPLLASTLAAALLLKHRQVKKL